ncbi:MAG: hypothetical protein IKK93_00840 [Campylobacter sp.]|nr:hypothetical protein [Campylobacter sp.]
MIEKTIRDLNYADYRLVDYGEDHILIEYKGVTHWRVLKKEDSYVLEDVTNGIKTIKIKQIKKQLGNKKILKWVLDALGVRALEAK